MGIGSTPRVGDLVNAYIGYGKSTLVIVEEVIYSPDDSDRYAVRDMSGNTFTIEPRDVGEVDDLVAAAEQLQAAGSHTPTLRVVHTTDDGGFITKGIISVLRE